jgi:hypothetical protein
VKNVIGNEESERVWLDKLRQLKTLRLNQRAGQGQKEMTEKVIE